MKVMVGAQTALLWFGAKTKPTIGSAENPRVIYLTTASSNGATWKADMLLSRQTSLL